MITSAPRSSWTRAVEVAAERHPFLGDADERTSAVLACALQAVDLEPSRVGEKGAAPGHESVEAAQPPHPFVAGSQVQVIGVAEDDPRAEFLEVPG
jgi:hypothetical protein